MPQESLVVRGARVHNLRNIYVEIPRNSMTVITGLSGSGKSSLAFDTIYAEGQRRYVESLSAYARQFLGLMEKPDVDSIEGLSPAISIEQKNAGHNPRSTVGTVTEIYDYLRLLWARAGVPHCPNDGVPIRRQSATQMTDQILAWRSGTRIEVLAPLVRGRKGEFKELLGTAQQQGFVRARIDGALYELSHPPKLNRRQNHHIALVVDRLTVKKSDQRRLTDSIETALRAADGVVEVLKHRGSTSKTAPDSVVFSERFSCPKCGYSLAELEPRQFSFNSPFGACSRCGGLGVTREVSRELVLADPRISILEGVVIPWGEPSGYLRTVVLPTLGETYGFNPAQPWGEIPEEVQAVLLDGDPDSTLTFRSRSSRKKSYQAEWEGILKNVERRYQDTSSDAVRTQLGQFMTEVTCEDCVGKRLKAESLSVLVDGKSIGDIVALPITETRRFFESLPVKGDGADGLDPEIAGPILREVTERLRFLGDVGLDYLTLGRAASTLSGGESQRIRLATQVGSRLVGVLYILDEPSVGLHPRDNSRLLATLNELRALGNTVLVVEHDEETIRSADYIVDLGPRAGRDGGEVVVQGGLDDVLACGDSLTGKYLRGDLRIAVPTGRRSANGQRAIRVKGAAHHNLREIDVDFPVGLFVAVTGVSGSGKSSLVTDVLYRSLARHFYRSKAVPGDHDAIEGLDQIDKVHDIDQSPIGRTPRSNPATYTGLFTPIRELFSQLPESKMRGYGPGRFSFNVKGGRCESCQGDGLVKIEMHFLPDVYVPCEVCKTKRYNRETLDVRYSGKSISDVLNLTVADALEFFQYQPRIRSKLEVLNDVGLGYIQLGQSATTLSGGEAQRVKLATELSKRDTGRTLYILDEPTTGLHFEDVRLLLDVLHRLVDRGNTVIVIEHNLHVVKTADWVIDLGPEGGEGGGDVIVVGTPETVAATPGSHTGRYLKKVLGM